MPREERRVRERSPIRRERENVPRYRPRVATPPPPGISRQLPELRDKVQWEKERHPPRRSRSPRGDRRRDNSRDRMRFEPPPRQMIGDRHRERDRDGRTRRDSPYRSEALLPRPLESKFIEERFSDRTPLHWVDSSQDLSSMLGYSGGPQHANRPLENPTDTPLIPEFNPETCKLNSEEWLALLEETAAERGWKQDEKVYIMTSRLGGFARQWYLTSGINCKSWRDLKDAFTKAFPTELDYHALLTRMLARVRVASEPLSTYFLHKVALLNECEIQGIKAVSCIIAGLANSKLQQEAKLQKCEDPDQLYLFLRTLDTENLSVTNSKQESKVEKFKGKDCFFCGQSGHIVAHCPRMKKHKCSVCHKIGHECEPLSIAKNQGMVLNEVMEGSLSHAEVEPKNFVEAFINGIVLKGYVDFDSECVTIREKNAIEARLLIKKQFKVVRGFAGSSLSSIGYAEAPMYIDRAGANVRLAVVPDNSQRIPVVVGQEFTSQPHVAIFKDGGRLRFHQRADNGGTRFDF